MHSVKVFPYDRINAIIYFQALSTYSGKNSISMEVDSKYYDYAISNLLLKGINTYQFNRMLQQNDSLYRSHDPHKIEEESEDSETQTAHPEKLKPHKFKDGDPQFYQK